MPLTDTYIRSLKVADKEQKHFDGGGLYLSIPKTGRKLWRMAYRFDQKTKLLSFGEYPTITLKDARQRRDEAKKLLANGIDPGAQKKAAKEEQISEVKDTFQSIALEWHDTRTSDFTEKHRGTVLYRLEKYIFPVIGNRHIAGMEASDLLAVVKPIEQKGQNETARRLLQIIGQVYRYAVITGRAKRNPATDLHGALKPRKTVHRAAITEPIKVAKLLRDCDNYDGYFPIVCALRLAPLVFVRPTELRAAEWNEFNLEAHEWRIPAERMKMKQMHIVPLSRQAVEILKELQPFSGSGKLLFPSVRTEIPKATILNFKTALEKAQEIIEQQSKALADRSILTAKNQKQQTEIQSLHQQVSAQSNQIMYLTVDKAQEQKKSNAALKKYMDANENLTARLDEFEKFLRWDTEANRRHLDYRQERQREAQQKAAEERQRKWEIEQRERQRQEELARQAKELEQQKALEVERQREERELAKARSLERRPRGKGMSR